MTLDDLLAPIEAREKAATKGPWSVDQSGQGAERFWLIADVLRDRYGNNAISSEDEATITFIAEARTDIPALLRLARAQDEALSKCREALEKADSIIKKFTGGGRSHVVIEKALAAAKLDAAGVLGGA